MTEPTRTGGKPTARAVAIVRRVLGPLVSLFFRPRLEGVEHIMAMDGPFMLVTNHNAGMGLAEVASFAVLYLDRVGSSRPLAGFAHRAAFRIWPMSQLLTEIGAVPSTYEDAEAALAAGVPLLVFPGGDHETLRPVWQANRVDFGGRKGFLRVAKKANVPILPMGIRGSHYTAPMLLRSRLLAVLLIVPRLIGIKRWGLSLLGIIGVVMLLLSPLSWPVKAIASYLWLGSPLVFVPIVPWTIRFRVGPPIDPDDLFASTETGDNDDLDPAYDRVLGAVQRMLDRA